MKKWAIGFLAGCLLFTGCSRTKDLMTVANLRSLVGLTITDRVGNQVVVQEIKAFEEAFRQAKAERAADSKLSILEADYRFEVGSTIIYYFTGGPYLVYPDGSKTHVYRTQAALTQLISAQFAKRPGNGELEIIEGAPSTQLEELARAITQVKTPVAYRLEYDDQLVFIFAAGEHQGQGHFVSVHKTTETGRGYIIDFRVTSPASPGVGTSYPYAVLTFSQPVTAIARTTEGAQVKEWPTIAVGLNQKVILLQPRSGSLLTQRVTLIGKASVPAGRLQVEIEDGHVVLAEKEFTVSASAPAWGDFEVTLDLEVPTSLSGTIIFFTEAQGAREEHLLIPILFTGGK